LRGDSREMGSQLVSRNDRRVGILHICIRRRRGAGTVCGILLPLIQGKKIRLEDGRVERKKGYSRQNWEKKSSAMVQAFMRTP